MTKFFIHQYLNSLAQHRRLEIASFLFCLGVSSIIAFKPWQPPTYKAEGTLVYNTSQVKISDLGTKIQQQSDRQPKEALLPQSILNRVAKETSKQPQQIAAAVEVKQPTPDSPKALKVAYVDTDQQRATETLKVLMQAMAQQSMTINQNEISRVIKLLQQQLPSQNAKVEQLQHSIIRYKKLNPPNRSSTEASSPNYDLANLEQQLNQSQELFSKSLAELEDAKLAQKEERGNLVIVRDPQVTAQSKFNNNFLLALATGSLGGVGISLIIIPLVGLLMQKSKTQSNNLSRLGLS